MYKTPRALSVAIVSLVISLVPIVANATTVTMGATTVFTNLDSGNDGLLLVQNATLSQAATVQSISFYVVNPAGTLELGIYDATGSGGGPGNLLATTTSFTPVAGWNTQNVVTPTALTAGNYWLAYTPSSGSLTFENNGGASGTYKQVKFKYAAMPAKFPTSGVTTGGVNWSFYATLNAGPDTTPPTVSMTAPTNGGYATSTAFTVSANASDNVAVASVQFLLDGANLGSAVTTSPYKLTWNTTTASNGSHTLLAVAKDTSGNVATSSSVTVTVDNQAPTGTIVINGGAAATNKTAVTLSLSAVDTQDAVTKMRFSNTGTSFNATVAYSTSASWTLTTGAGTKTVYAQFMDAAGNWSAAAISSIVLDTTAPTISAIASSGVTGSSATITWTTNEPASSQVNYGLTNIYGSTTTLDTTLVTSHSVTLSGLSPSTTYHFRVRSSDAAGNLTVSVDKNFKTTAVTDTQPPTVPANVTATGVSVSQINVAWATSTDNVGVAGYQVFRNGVRIATSTTTTYADTGLSPNTTYTYTVTAYDAAGNISAQSSPAQGTTLPDTIPPSVPANLAATNVTSSSTSISWSPSTDNVGVAGYQVFRNGVQVGTTTGVSYMDTGLSPSTTYTYTVTAFDAAGNISAQSTSLNATTLTPDTTPPSVPTNLAQVAVTSSSASISWSPSTDNVGVAGYQVFRNGTQVGTTTSTNFTDTSLTPSTMYAYTVTAFDTAANVSAQSSPLSITTASVVQAMPTLIQQVTSSANPVGIGISGNNFNVPLPNAVGAGNTLVLGITYPSGSTPTITDNNGNVWPSTPSITANPGSGGYASSIFVLPNANPGITTVTVSFPLAVIPFEYMISEFDNVATVSPVSGESAATNVVGPSLSSGSFTPANNDANGGNLIWSYYALSQIADGNPTDWVPGSGSTLLDADVAWVTKQGFPHASEYLVQPTDAAINPSITTTGDSSNDYNAVSVALKAANVGTPVPSGIHINKLIHQTSNSWPTNGTLSMQAPTTGNLLVLEYSSESAGVTSVTDSDGGTWNHLVSNAVPGIWWSANRTPDPNLVVTFHTSGGTGATQSVRFFDISGAAASPFDTSTSTDEIDASNQTVLNDHPDFTPSTPNELVIAATDLGQGPGLGFAPGAPSGAIFDLTTYTGELDFDLMENADGVAHLYNADTSTERWNWSITSQPSNSSSGVAVAFKAAGN